MTNVSRPLSISDIARSRRGPVAAAGNRPIQLDDPGTCWFVEEGALDVFLAEYEDGKAATSPSHVMRVGPGRLVFGSGEAGYQLKLFAKAIPDTVVRRVQVGELVDDAAGDEVACQVDAWLTEFGATVAGRVEPRARPSLLLEAGTSLDVPEGAVLSTHPGRVVWASTDVPCAYLGTEDAELAPLTSDTWLTIFGSTGVAGLTSVELNRQGRLFEALAEFHRLALGAEQLNRMLLLADSANEEVARSTGRQMDRVQARHSLFNILGTARTVTEGGGSPLLAALHIVGRHEGIEFREPSRRRMQLGRELTLQDILNASGIRARRVVLSSQDRWWLGDSGAMLGFKSDGSPVALLPGVLGRYRAVDPATGRSERVNGSRSAAIRTDAWLFYRPLQDDSGARTSDLVRFVIRNNAPDLGRFMVAGLLSSLLAVAPGIVVGTLVNSTIPAASERGLVQFLILLLSLAMFGFLLQMLQGTSLMRLEGRAAARLSSAAWDRLMGLPASFFKGFTAGELALRMMVFQTMRDQVSAVAATALLSLAFLLVTLPLLFLFDTALGLATLAVGAFSVGVTSLLGLLQIAPHRRRYAASRRLAGDLLQSITGIGKIRTAGAEGSAFAAWARGYREQQLATMQISRVTEHLAAFYAAGPALMAAALFGVVVLLGVDRFDIGSFLVIFAVSITVYASIVGLGVAFEAIAAFVPGYEQIRPILEAQPERRVDEAATVELVGDIRFDHVSFRYDPEGPLIVDDASIHVRPGEFVAIVGESGSGKSTLLRLALGLEDPETGGVYYDGRDMAYLSRRAVRKQIGVVPQDSTLHPGNIMENIIGMGEDLTVDDAWRAARLAALDADIIAMPMGMFTFVGDRSATFSGGQTQRIKIAAALVKNPRIVFLDEATSWLDARSQAEVMQGIESMASTRIVIAHRLSTIRRAERIYVMDGGRVVQTGTFEELYEVEGRSVTWCNGRLVEPGCNNWVNRHLASRAAVLTPEYLLAGRRQGGCEGRSARRVQSAGLRVCCSFPGCGAREPGKHLSRVSDCCPSRESRKKAGQDTIPS